MKTKLQKLSLVLLLLLTSLNLVGCSTSGMAKIAAQLKNDPATVSIQITTIYGTVKMVRLAPGTNTPPHSVAADGSVNVTDKRLPQ